MTLDAPASGVVLDTNVVVAAGFNSGSASARVIQAVRQGHLLMVWCCSTRGEMLTVLGRIPRLSAMAVEPLFREEGRYAGSLHPERFTDVPDPDDRMFAALAHAVGVPLVSSDTHLLRQRLHPDLLVLTPARFRAGR